MEKQNLKSLWRDLIIFCRTFNLQPCSGGGACVIPRPWELYWRKLQLLVGLTKPGRSKGRIQTNRWSNRWQQVEGSAHRQIQSVVFWLRVTVVLGRTLRLLVGVASINSQVSNQKKFPKRFDQWVSDWHPDHIKNFIIYSQTLRSSNICTYEEDFDKHALNMKSWFLERGYSEQMIDSQMGKVRSIFCIDINTQIDRQWKIMQNLLKKTLFSKCLSFYWPFF